MSRSYRHADTDTYARATRDADRRAARRQAEAARYEAACAAQLQRDGFEWTAPLAYSGE